MSSDCNAPDPPPLLPPLLFSIFEVDLKGGTKGQTSNVLKKNVFSIRRLSLQLCLLGDFDCGQHHPCSQCFRAHSPAAGNLERCPRQHRAGSQWGVGRWGILLPPPPN